ncbi:MAG: hypothetical protein AAFQ80_15190 [Cyanobacteria bacterium J06621_8]
MNYLNYNKLKQVIVINKKHQEKFRPQNEIERENLKADLLYHKEILNPLKVRQTITGYELIDGHHRWELLPEVIRECAEFKLDIPIVFIDLASVPLVMLQTQLGRRNLDSETIAKYVDSLRQNGETKGKAIKQAAEDLNVSVNSVKNAVYPGRAEQAKEYSKNYHTNNDKTLLLTSSKSLPISARNQPQSIENSLEDFDSNSTIKSIQKQEVVNRAKENTTYSNKYPNKTRKPSREQQIKNEFEELERELQEDVNEFSKIGTIGDLVKENDQAIERQERVKQIAGIIATLQAIVTQIRVNNLRIKSSYISEAIQAYNSVLTTLEE